MKDFSSNRDIEQIDPEIEALFYLSDEELSELIRTKFGDEEEFVERASNVFDRALVDFSGKTVASLKNNGAAEVIDIRSKLAWQTTVQPRYPSRWKLFWEEVALNVQFRGEITSWFAVASAAFIMLSALVAERSIDIYFVGAAVTEVKTSTVPMRGLSWRTLSFDRKLAAAKKDRDEQADKFLFVGHSFRQSSIPLVFDREVAANLNNLESIYERRTIASSRLTAGRRSVQTVSVTVGFDPRDYAFSLIRVPPPTRRKSGTQIDTVDLPRMGFAPEGSSVRD